MYTDPLNSKIIELKNNPSSLWGRIFGRLVLGWLQEYRLPGATDLIVANPTFGSSSSGLGHTEAVLSHAYYEDQLGAYPIPDPRWPVLIKNMATPPSKSGSFDAKKSSADALHQALALPGGDESVAGKRVIVYDDILTTGSQLDAVARYLVNHGANSVEGLVLARVGWRY